MLRATKSEFESALAGAKAPHERVGILGALLARAVGPRTPTYVVGDSAISIWTEGKYVSGDIDVVGPRSRIEPVLEGWGFEREVEGSRTYWSRDDLGLAVDILDRPDYVGLRANLLRTETPVGPVRVAAAEDLILRRLILWKRSGRPEFLDQAVLIWAAARGELDFEYLEVLARRERIGDALAELRRLASSARATGGTSR